MARSRLPFRCERGLRRQERRGESSTAFTTRLRTSRTKDVRERPKLHLKANFFASPLVWDQLMTRPEWGGILAEYIDYLAGQQASHGSRNARPRPASGRFPKSSSTAWRCSSMRSTPPCPSEQRGAMISYLTLGSANMDYRSMSHERRGHGDHFRHREPGGRDRLRSARPDCVNGPSRRKKSTSCCHRQGGSCAIFQSLPRSRSRPVLPLMIGTFTRSPGYDPSCSATGRPDLRVVSHAVQSCSCGVRLCGSP